MLELTYVPMLGEVSIYVLEGPIGCLGIEEVRGWYEAEAKDCPDDPELVAQVRDARWCYLGDHVIHDPICCHREGSTFASE